MRIAAFFMGIALLSSCTQEQTEFETKNTYPKMNLKEIHTDAKAAQTKMLLQAEEGKVISLQIEAGEQLKEHVSKVPALLVCVSGRGIYKDESGETSMEEGDYVFIKKDVKHEVDAITKANFLLMK